MSTRESFDAHGQQVRFLLNDDDMDRAFKLPPRVTDECDNHGYIISVVIGDMMIGTKSVVMVSKVAGWLGDSSKNDVSDNLRYVHIVDIPLHQASVSAKAVRDILRKVVNKYAGATVVLARQSGTLWGYRDLTKLLCQDEIDFLSISMESAPFFINNKTDFFDKRAHAYVSMAKAVERQMVSISSDICDKKELAAALRMQMTGLRYRFDELSRWQLRPPTESVSPPICWFNLAEALSLVFSEGVHCNPFVEKEDKKLLKHCFYRLARKLKSVFTKKPATYSHLMIYLLMVKTTISELNFNAFIVGKGNLSTFYVFSVALIIIFFTIAFILEFSRLIFYKKPNVNQKIETL